ncbi:AraC family transcriptional regulator [Piscinibacter gummiphilus]|nr:AraC family transcriptional regulator [Piscinibacter gummiphilus]
MTRHGPPRPPSRSGDPWDTVPGVQVLRMITVLRRTGIDAEPTLAEFGLPADLRSDTPVETRRMVAWMEHLLARHPHRGLGLLYGEMTNPLDLGIVGHTIASATSLGQALDAWTAYIHLVRPLIETRIVHHDDVVEVQFIEREPTPYGRAMRAFWQEGKLAGWALALRRLTGVSNGLVEVHCAFPDPQLPDRYREVFGCPVYHDRPQTLLRFPRAMLDLPLPHSHDEAHRLCEAQCVTLNEEMEAATSTTAAVRRLLLRDPTRLPELGPVAEALGMSARTLRRKLGDEQTRFTDVLHEVRMRAACDYLRTTTEPVGHIATQLGFSDESAFGRAFRRTYAVTPRAYRARPPAIAS